MIVEQEVLLPLIVEHKRSQQYLQTQRSRMLQPTWACACIDLRFELASASISMSMWCAIYHIKLSTTDTYFSKCKFPMKYVRDDCYVMFVISWTSSSIHLKHARSETFKEFWSVSKLSIIKTCVCSILFPSPTSHGWQMPKNHLHMEPKKRYIDSWISSPIQQSWDLMQLGECEKPMFENV